MKELTRFEIAACKRVAANTKSLRTKVEKLNAKIAELSETKATYLNEIAMWESPIVEKYGYTVEQILDGSYLLAEGEVIPEITVEDAAETVVVTNDEFFND